MYQRQWWKRTCDHSVTKDLSVDVNVGLGWNQEGNRSLEEFDGAKPCFKISSVAPSFRDGVDSGVAGAPSLYGTPGLVKGSDDRRQAHFRRSLQGGP